MILFSLHDHKNQRSNHPNKLLLRYLSPLSQTINTITPDVNSFASRIAAEAAPPLLIPANIPSAFASWRVISVASCCDTSITLSTRSGSNIFGKYSLGHRRIPGIDDSSVGWQPMICIEGFISLKYLEQPMIVPVVPIELTK